MQEITSWEKTVNSINTDFDVDIYVTGSNSRMMSSEIATYLTGRYVSFRIFTLSFEEYLTFKKRYGEVKDIHKELINYIRYGGFPAIHLQEYPLVLFVIFIIQPYSQISLREIKFVRLTS